VGVDGSEESRTLVGAAAVIADDVGAHLVVMHAWRPVGQYDAAIGARTLEERWEMETRPLIDKLVDPVRSKHPDVEIRVNLRYERPVVGLFELTRSSDLVVIGRHRYRVPVPPRLGSTTRTLLRTCERPVLVVPTTPPAEE
jgi:nucleotide-binding universal stress UspA family protein